MLAALCVIMNNGIYKTTHAFYAYTVACASGVIVNGIVIFLMHLLLPVPTNEEIIILYVGQDGAGFFIGTLILGAVLYRYTKNFKIVKRN